MEGFLVSLAAVVVVGGPVLAWVIRVEKKLTRMCVTIQHIYKILERRQSAIRQKDETPV